jgi:hypothetical protein
MRVFVIGLNARSTWRLIPLDADASEHRRAFKIDENRN